MLARVSSLLLSLITAERLKPIGFRLLIASLAADVLVLIFVASGIEEKILSAICTVGIIAGIWFEEIADRQLHDAELARLEKKLAPRVITAEAEAKIIGALKPFPKTPFMVEADPAETEFANRLIVVLQRATWKWAAYAVVPSLPPGDRGDIDCGIGVQVRINRARLSDWFDPATALGFTLTEALGASVSIVGDPPESDHACSPDAIHIEIARKL